MLYYMLYICCKNMSRPSRVDAFGDLDGDVRCDWCEMTDTRRFLIYLNIRRRRNSSSLHGQICLQLFVLFSAIHPSIRLRLDWTVISKIRVPWIFMCVRIWVWIRNVTRITHTIITLNRHASYVQWVLIFYPLNIPYVRYTLFQRYPDMNIFLKILGGVKYIKCWIQIYYIFWVWLFLS